MLITATDNFDVPRTCHIQKDEMLTLDTGGCPVGLPLEMPKMFMSPVDGLPWKATRSSNDITV
jgi:hypothetical protein